MTGSLDLNSFFKTMCGANDHDPDHSDTSGDEPATSSIASLLQNSEGHDDSGEDGDETGNIAQLLLRQYQ